MRVAIGFALLLLGGCAGTDNHMRLLEAGNDVRVEPSQTPGSDFIVSIRNTKDLGHDPDNKATRDGVALRMLREQCPGGKIVGETVINTGQYLLGNPARTYSIRVKC